MSMSEALLSAHEVSMSFGGVRALDTVSLEVRRAEVLAIIGPNGAGKTTLFNILSRTFPPTGGEVRFLGHSLGHRRAHEVARLGMARTFQNLQVFGQMTVLENVLVGCHVQGHTGFVAASLRLPLTRREERALRERAEEALQRVGLLERAGELAANLPVGQQRLLELARALGSTPQLLLLDEPAAGLTTRETAALSALVLRLRDELGLTVALIEHDMTLVMGISDRVAVLNHGQKIADDVPSVVQKDPQVVAAYLGVGD
jgi:branched-chain amino acid transport system ATP-binding protein